MRLHFVVASVLAICLFASAANAQQPRAEEARAIVTSVAPIYIYPDATRQPLRTAAVNTTLKLIEEQGEWLRVEFQDPQYGRRVGWVESRNVRVVRPEQTPMDLSIRSDPPTRQPVGVAPPSGEPSRQTTPRARRPASSSSQARACLGAPSTPGLVGAGIGIVSGAQSISVDVGSARDRFWSDGLFQYQHFESDDSVIGWGGLFGGDVAPSGQPVHFCPYASFTYAHLMDSSVNEVDITGGGALGIVAYASRTVSVIPTFSVAYIRAIVLDGGGQLNIGAARVGVGLVFNENVGFYGGVSFPINAGTSDPGFNLSVSVGFGR